MTKQTAEVIELRPVILKKLALQFVDKYERDGKLAAGQWLMPKIERHERDRIRVHIEEEFKRRGYEFPA